MIFVTQLQPQKIKHHLLKYRDCKTKHTILNPTQDTQEPQ